MEIVVTGRHTQVSDRFRAHLDEKLAKVAQLAPRATRIDVVVSHEPNRRQAKACERVEVTVHGKGKVSRAEACSDDPYAALDLVMDKLMERLRRTQDRRRVHRGRQTPESVARATARVEAAEAAAPPPEDHDHDPDLDRFGAQGNSPIEVREKVHASAPMDLESAVAAMEAVGHDFYLFHDTDTGQPSVVYRRRGWSYGVLHLDVDTAAEGASDHAPVTAAAAG